MTLLAALAAFAPLAVAITITPGADMTLVLRTAVRRGPGAALVTGLGIGAGALVWGVAAAVGVGALVRSHPALHRLLAYAGAAYLAYLGIRMLLTRAHGDDQGPRRGSAFVQGLMTNLLNPKIGVFYVSVIPQFPVPGVSPALVGLSLAALHVAVTMALFAAIAAGAGRLGTWLSDPRVGRGLDVVCGLVLLAFAVVLAVRA